MSRRFERKAREQLHVSASLSSTELRQKRRIVSWGYLILLGLLIFGAPASQCYIDGDRVWLCYGECSTWISILVSSISIPVGYWTLKEVEKLTITVYEKEFRQD